MKRESIYFHITHTILMCVIFLFASLNCSAKSNGPSWTQYALVDSIVKNHLGDSITNELIHAKKIVVSELTTENDSIEYINPKKLKKVERGVLLYLFLDKDMMNNVLYNTYGKFCPMIRAEFIGKKGRKIILYMDLSLSRWKLVDSTSNEISKGSIYDKRMNRLFYFLFPKSDLINHIFNFEPQI